MNGEQLDLFAVDAPTSQTIDKAEFSAHIAANAPKDPYRDYNARLLLNSEKRDHGYLPVVVDTSADIDDLTPAAPEELPCDPKVAEFWISEARASLARASEEITKRDRTIKLARRLLY